MSNHPCRTTDTVTSNSSVVYGAYLQVHDLDAGGFTATLSPNPAADVVNFAFAGNKVVNTDIRILDALGNTVVVHNVGKVACGTVDLSLNGLPDGVYMVRLVAGETVMTRRLIKLASQR